MAIEPIHRVMSHLREAALRHAVCCLEDAELLERYVTRRDEAAFESLVRRHGPMVLGVCRRILRNEADAEDAFQATFLVLVRKAKSIRSRAQVSNWLFGVAHNTALKAKAMNHKRCTKEAEAGRMANSQAAEEKWQEIQALMDDEVSRLPEKYRVAIVLCELESKTVREAALHLGWPQGTVASRLARGRVLLARRLSRPGLAFSAGTVVTLLARNAMAAHMPAPLIGTTLKAATLIAAGCAAADIVSAKVAALTEGVVKAMLLTKLKIATAILLVTATLAAGVATSTPEGQTQPSAPGTAQNATAPAGQKAAPTVKPKGDTETIQGRWKVAAFEIDGWNEPTEELVGVRITANKLFIKYKNGLDESTYRLDESRKPKHIDLAAFPGENKAGAKGIYYPDGDRLVLCFAPEKNERPTEFKTEPKSGAWLMVLQRDKPVVPPEPAALPPGPAQYQIEAALYQGDPLGNRPGTIKILAKPTITTISGQEATVVAGQQVQFSDESLGIGRTLRITPTPDAHGIRVKMVLENAELLEQTRDQLRVRTDQSRLTRVVKPGELLKLSAGKESDKQIWAEVRVREVKSAHHSIH
jgi:RNA polymerase sigma factor (sigma-70 family)